MSNLIYRVIYQVTRELTHRKEQGDAPAGASDNGAPGNAAAPTPSRRYSTQPRSPLPPIRLLAYPNGLPPPGAAAAFSFSCCGSAKKAAAAAYVVYLGGHPRRDGVLSAEEASRRAADAHRDLLAAVLGE